MLFRSSCHRFTIDPEEFGATSHGDAGSEKRTQLPVDGPEALPLFQVVGPVRPGSLAANASILRDFDFVANSDVGGIAPSGPSTTLTFWIHSLGKSKWRAETAP